MKPTWLDRGLFISPFYYTLATDEATFRKALKHLGIAKANRPAFLVRDSADGTCHFFTKDRDLTAVVCIRVEPSANLAQVVGLFAHEATHLWQAAREHTGEATPSAELEAYAVQTFTQRLFEEYVRQVKVPPGA